LFPVDASGRALAGQRTCRERGLNGRGSEERGQP
jgi:hypothetical protein